VEEGFGGHGAGGTENGELKTENWKMGADAGKAAAATF
jgi:hypothetical protein